jgi:hypothetical protein
MNNQWIHTNTFHYEAFKNLDRLARVKEQRGLGISLCLPTLNEEKTIAKEIVIFKSELMTRFPLIDEIVVIDSGSTDDTCSIASEFGADVYLASEILPCLESFSGKGENLWKALYVTTGDIIVYLDADIKNIHHRFAYGLIGPLLMDEKIKYAKGFYDRPITTWDNKIRPTGGGRVTELVLRPLFSLFFSRTHPDHPTPVGGICRIQDDFRQDTVPHRLRHRNEHDSGHLPRVGAGGDRSSRPGTAGPPESVDQSAGQNGVYDFENLHQAKSGFGIDRIERVPS